MVISAHIPFDLNIHMGIRPLFSTQFSTFMPFALFVLCVHCNDLCFLLSTPPNNYNSYSIVCEAVNVWHCLVLPSNQRLNRTLLKDEHHISTSFWRTNFREIIWNSISREQCVFFFFVSRTQEKNLQFIFKLFSINAPWSNAPYTGGWCIVMFSHCIRHV